jgi:hypothetical protein
MPARYSRTPLANKPGIVDGSLVPPINEPDGFLGLLHPIPDVVDFPAGRACTSSGAANSDELVSPLRSGVLGNLRCIVDQMCVAFDVQRWKNSVKPARQPPVLLSE